MDFTATPSAREKWPHVTNRARLGIGVNVVFSSDTEIILLLHHACATGSASTFLFFFP
jgi:hypothetical protein